jgi:hypothetical protein
VRSASSAASRSPAARRTCPAVTRSMMCHCGAAGSASGAPWPSRSADTSMARPRRAMAADRWSALRSSFPCIRRVGAKNTGSPRRSATFNAFPVHRASGLAGGESDGGVTELDHGREIGVLLEPATHGAGTGDTPVPTRDPGRVPSSGTPNPQFRHTESLVRDRRPVAPSRRDRSSGAALFRRARPRP